MKSRQVIFKLHDATASSPMKFSVGVYIGPKYVRRFFARNFKISFEANIYAIAKALGLEIASETFTKTGAILQCNSEKFDTLHNYWDATGASGAKKKLVDRKILHAPL